VAVEPVVLRERRGEALLEILERLAAPVLADRIRELLAIARRAVEVDEHDAIAVPGPHLRVPAIAPGIPERHLVSAMNDARYRVCLAGGEADRFHHILIPRLVVPSLEAELLVLAHRTLAEDVLVHVREATRVTAIRALYVQIRRTPETRERIHDK